MSLYLSICKDEDNKEFLLISEQLLDAKLPRVKAQIYFEAPASKLEKNEIDVASYAISKKEVEIILNKAQQRHSSGFRSNGLFAEGKVEKGSLFNIFSYPSKETLENLLTALDVSKPTKEQYIKRLIKPDQERILENRHQIYWDNFLELSNRKTIDINYWTQREIREAKCLNEFNLMRMFLHDNFDIPVE